MIKIQWPSVVCYSLGTAKCGWHIWVREYSHLPFGTWTLKLIRPDISRQGVSIMYSTWRIQREVSRSHWPRDSCILQITENFRLLDLKILIRRVLSCTWRSEWMKVIPDLEKACLVFSTSGFLWGLNNCAVVHTYTGAGSISLISGWD